MYYIYKKFSLEIDTNVLSYCLFMVFSVYVLVLSNINKKEKKKKKGVKLKPCECKYSFLCENKTEF